MIRKSLAFVLLAVLSVAPGYALGAAKEPGDAELLFQEALHKEEGSGDLEAALDAYRKIVTQYEQSRVIAAKAHYQIARILERQGKKDEAVQAYGTLAGDFAGCQQAQQARDRLAELGVDVPKGQNADRILEAQLQKTIPYFEFTGVPFATMLEFLRSTRHINIVVDSAVSETYGQDGRPLVTLRLEEATVAQILTLMIESSGLDATWTVWNGAVYVAPRATIDEIARQTRVKLLADKEAALLDQKVEIAEQDLAIVRARLESGAASMTDVNQATRTLIEVQGERLAFERVRRVVESDTPGRAGGPPAGGAVMGGGGRVTFDASENGPQIVSVAPDADLPVETAYEIRRQQFEQEGYQYVRLYRHGLPNFESEQALDLENYQTRTVPDENVKAFFEANPSFDIIFAVVPFNPETPGIVNGPQVILNNNVQIADVYKGATAQSVPHNIAYQEHFSGPGELATYYLDERGYRLRRLGDIAKIVLRTPEREYLVILVRGANADFLEVAFAPLPARPEGGVDVAGPGKAVTPSSGAKPGGSQ